VVFTTPEGLFEPPIMFFGLKNSPAILQTIMNELLRDLINSRKVDVIERFGHEQFLFSFSFIF